jgi:hypothetical protein
MKVIGIGGFARAGKDAFVSIARNILEKNGYTSNRFAFADNLKLEVGSMLKANSFELDVYTSDSNAKSKLRPLMVWWGCARRDLSDGGLYWVEQVHKQLEAVHAQMVATGINSDKFVALISDVRFVNEAKWLHEKWEGQFIHLRRFSMQDVRDGYGDTVQGKVFDPAPNEEEAKNDPLIQAMADVKVEWESRGIAPGGCVTKDTYLQEKVLEALNSTSYFKHKTTGILSI